MSRTELESRLQSARVAHQRRQQVTQVSEALLLQCDPTFRLGMQLVPLLGFPAARNNGEAVYLWVASQFETDLPLTTELLVSRLRFEICDLIRGDWGI